MRYTFLHVADFHYRPDWPEETELVFSNFIEDLTTQVKQFDNLWLIFSGDLVNAGGADGAYKVFHNRIEPELNRLGFPHNRRICVPGNHDISQAALQPVLLMQKGTLAEIKDEEGFNRELHQLSEMIFDPKFKAYKAAENDFAKQRCCQISVGGCGWDLPDDVGVYCLNTALCSFGGLKDPTTDQKIPDKDKLMI